MTDRPGNLTLEEIGRLAGVSRSTVSRVLNAHPHVRPDVRIRVEDVIAQTGYLPNQAARALVSNRTGLIGLVMPTNADDLFGDPYYSALVNGIQDGCAELGSILAILPVAGPDDQTAVLPTLVAQGFVDGVIVTAGSGSERLIGALRGRGKRMVVVGHPVDDDDLVRVDVENRAGSAHATAHLIDVGRHRVAFIGPGADFVYGSERLAGYRDAVLAAGRDASTLVRLDEPTADGGHRAASSLLRHQPDAVHVATDTMAEGALRAFAEHGVEVPADVAVVGFDGLPGAPQTSPALTTVVQPVTEVGHTSVRLLLDEHTSAGVVLLPTTLRIGASCGAEAQRRSP